MYGTLDIKVNAANVNMPLQTVYTTVNSPIHVRVLNVPKPIGKAKITDVFVSVTYPDGRIVTQKTELIGGVYVAVVSPCTTSGKSYNGLQIIANGTDVDGNSVEGYCLGIGDIVVLDRDGTYVDEGTKHYLHLIDKMPDNPNIGDMIFDDGTYLIYDGGEWKATGLSKTEINNFATKAELGNKADKSYVDTQDESLNGLIQTVNNKVDSIDDTLVKMQSDIDSNSGAITNIKDVISDTATKDNKLADVNFVNSSINNMAAFYITKNQYGDAFVNYAELFSATVFYCGGVVRVPTQNDYCIVLADEVHTTTQGNPTTRYSYQGGIYPNGQWSYQYTVNNTPLTQAQIEVLNCGITKTKVEQIETNRTDIENIKTNKADLTAVYQKSEISSFVFSGEYEDSSLFSFDVMYLRNKVI